MMTTRPAPKSPTVAPTHAAAVFLGIVPRAPKAPPADLVALAAEWNRAAHIANLISSTLASH
jgi:hypothetical protein